MEYEEIKLLKQSEKSIVQLVHDKDGEQIFVRKILKGCQPIYLFLQTCDHPNLPKIYDVAMSDNTTTIIEEYIEGEWLGSSELSQKQVLRIVRELCSVLDFLHGKGIIHRDIKPSNIIYTKDGHIYLIDFDAARMPKEGRKQDTRLLGTRGYAPPEQYGFEQTDVRADIYALGMTLKQIFGNKIRNPRYKRIIQKCTKLDPDKRYQSVRKVKKAFFHREWDVLCVLIFLTIILCVFLLNDGFRNNMTISQQAERDIKNSVMALGTALAEKDLDVGIAKAEQATGIGTALAEEDSGIGLTKAEEVTEIGTTKTEEATEAGTTKKGEDTEVESETVSIKEASERYPNQILWKNIPIRRLIGTYVDDAIEELGTMIGTLEEEHKAQDENDDNYYRYQYITFCFDAQRRVVKIGMGSWDSTFNGINMEVNAEKLVEIFGSPTFSGQNKPTGKYYLDYYNHYKKSGFTFYFDSFEEPAYSVWVD